MPVSKVIGFDFLPGKVRVVALAGRYNKFSVSKIGDINVPVHDEAPEQFFPDEAAMAIKDWVRDTGLKGYRSAFSFQERKSILRVLSVPKMAEEELSSTVNMEFSQVMEDSMDNYCLDYSIIGEEVEEETGRYRILVAIVPKASVYPYVDTLEAIRLSPVRAGLPVLSSITAIHSTKPEYLEGNVVCVHLETIGGDVVIIQNSEIVFIRRMSIGLGELKYAFRGIIESKSPAEIENVGGYKQDDYVVPKEHFATAKPIINMVYAEVERTLSFFKSQRQIMDYTFDRLIICGNGIWPRNLDELLAKDIPKTILLSNPLDWARSSLAFEPTREEELELPRFSTALGVALEALD